MNKQTKEWSRARLCKPKDNLTTEAGKRERFVPSCELEVNLQGMCVGHREKIKVLPRIDVSPDWMGIRPDLATRSR
nr:uncharacterized protein LOC108012760 isoform X2 [Drosophila suzukii]